MNNLTGNRARKTARKYRTDCKICRCAIYADEPCTWVAEPQMTGLCHDCCIPT
jgi:hypothetical protein